MSVENTGAFLLFGSESPDIYRFITTFCSSGSPGVLVQSFIERAILALLEEVETLPRPQRDQVQTFRTLAQLNTNHHFQAEKHPGVDNALVCIAQLSDYIDRVEKDVHPLTSNDRTVALGFGPGSFAAAAVISASSVTMLIPIAVAAVVLSFRMGSYVASLAYELCPAVNEPGPWAMSIDDLKEADVVSRLGQFHEKNNTPKPSRAYVSAVSDSDITISGVPSTLRTIREQKILGGQEPVMVPVYGPYHANHLHGATDVARIIGIDDPKVLKAVERSRPRSRIMSMRGTWIAETETRSLFVEVARQCLVDVVNTPKVHDGCIEAARTFLGKSKLLVLPLGPTSANDMLAEMLESSIGATILQRPDLTPESSSSSSLSATSSPELTAATLSPFTKGRIGQHGSTGKCRLAIVGMAGRFPDAASHQLLWELLAKGLDVHRPIPPDRFPAETHVDATGKSINTSHTPFGCWIENPGLFDPRFFNMSPREAYQTDPMQRMAITTAYEALEMAGYVPNRTSSTRLDRIGTFYGQTSDDWREVNAAQDVDTYFITGGVRAFGPGRINYHFGFSGPSLNIDTACSSSAAALHVACSSLWAKECDTAIVGGLSCMTNSDIFSGLSRGQFLSKTGGCKTFDHGADGYCRADGCASIIVKRLDDALADRDNVLAIILGTLTNHSADAISITHPHGPTQSILSRAILDEAGVDPIDVDYVEMHGTGTQAGDGTEMVSVTDVFAPADRHRPSDRPLYIGAIKANIGHGEAASGVTALIKVMMMMQKNQIPPHVGIKKEINKTFPKDLDDRNVKIAFEMTPLRRGDGNPRRIFVNNFSAAGGNTGLLLEDGPKYPPPTKDPRPIHVVTVTAKSKLSMIRNAEKLVQWIDQHPDTPLPDLAYSTTARKIQHYWRMNVTATTLREASDAIKARVKESFQPVSSEQPKVAFVFTGQGSQYAGLGKDLYRDFSIFRSAIDELHHISHAILGFPSFMPLIDGSEPDVAKLSTVVTQVGLCCFEIALARLWMAWGVQPAVVIGHSLGEYAALHVAGVLSASDTIYLVGSRAQLLVKRCTPGTHAMLAAQGSVLRVTEVLGSELYSKVSVACINGPEQTVLSGAASDMAGISERLAKAGLKATMLQLPFAFHSAQVDVILDDFAAMAQPVQFHSPKVATISSLLGRLVRPDESIDATYLRNHARDAVNFHSGLLTALQAGVVDPKTIWLEVGPHPVCVGFVKATFGSSSTLVPSLRRNEDTYKTLTASLCALHTAGLNLDWNEHHRDFASSTRLLDLPSYSFDYKNYWLQYEGEWLLTKNRGAIDAPLGASTSTPKHKLSTTSVHGVVREEVKDGIAVVETETNLSRDDTRNIVTGHLCNGTPLCPSTLYADMAMTVADYGYRLVKPDTGDELGLNVADMNVPKTLIFDEKLPAHVLRCTAVVNPKGGFTDIVFSTGEGKKKIEHAFCKVLFGNKGEWANEINRMSYLIQARIESMVQAEKNGLASKIGRGLAYKLFSALVDYDKRYRGMEEVILDSQTCEATSKVSFQTSAEDGSFFCNPYWIDSCCHISGFVINGTDAVDSREQVFISHGWGSLRYVQDMQRDQKYRSYIRMQPVDGSKMMAGDVYVFDSQNKIVALAGDVRFQSIPRRVLNTVLPPRGAAASSGVAARPAPAPAARAAVAVAEAPAKQVTPSSIATVNQRLAKSVTASVMDILAKEVGCSNDELADNINFNDLGVDSLMALTVSGRMREDLELDIDSYAFVEHPTIGAFKGFLAQFETVAKSELPPASPVHQAPPSASSSTTQSNSSGFDSPPTARSGMTTPESSDKGSDEGEKDAGKASEMRQILRCTIADAMGVEVDEIIAAPDLTLMGMDSLMSLTILGTLRERTGLDLSPELFNEFPSLMAVEKELGITAAAKPVQNGSVPAVPASATPTSIFGNGPSHPRAINTHPGNTTASYVKPPRPSHVPDNHPHRKASSVLLQGKTTAPRQLWMIPDGSGSATSYTEIGRMSPDWAVWGLFSPFMKTPHEYDCGVYGIATKFIEEMIRRQPEGPYSVAGWSAGGIIAYEMVQQLTRAGKTVDHLILIDSPCPITIEPLPKSLHEWFAGIGLLGEDDPKAGKPSVPEWLLPHFAASVAALSVYHADPIPKEIGPRIIMTVWCEDGVCKLPTDPRPDPYPTGHAQFLLDNRTDFGPNRWDEYLAEDRFLCRHLPGNHFTMMHGELAKKLGDYMREAIMI